MRLTGRCSLIEAQSNDQRAIELIELLVAQGSDKVGQACFGNADEFITMNAAFVFQAFVWTNQDLSGKSVVGGIDRGTYHG